MNIQETAKKVAELCRKGEFQEATASLYADDIVSVEPEHAPGDSRIQGIEAKRHKDEYFSQMVTDYHALEVSEPLVAGNHFTLKMVMDTTHKDGKKSKMEEVCVYHVNDKGKIDYEEFFYAAPEN